jgi:hypothetical protein
MKAKAEIVWAAAVRDRLMTSLDLEPLRLWGIFKDIILHLEWATDDPGNEKRLPRFIIFVKHP